MKLDPRSQLKRPSLTIFRTLPLSRQTGSKSVLPGLVSIRRL
jgi:hypothetical protein